MIAASVVIIVTSTWRRPVHDDDGPGPAAPRRCPTRTAGSPRSRSRCPSGARSSGASRRGATRSTVVLLYAIDDRRHRARGLGEQPDRLGARVPRDGSGDRPLQHPHARSRAPAAVRQPQGQRLRRALVPRVPGVRADRPLPPRPHGPSPRGVRPERARHPALLAATRSRATRCAASSPATRSARPA